jgi:hypothetical protein
MDIEIICRQSAFKHGVTEADIRSAFTTAIYDHLIKGFTNKYMLYGFNVAGNLLEVYYNEIEEGTVNVFHAIQRHDVSFIQ